MAASIALPVVVTSIEGYMVVAAVILSTISQLTTQNDDVNAVQ
ncbi:MULTISPECIES: hypothetical protein [unclassified Flavobacterium]|nr:MULTISPECIES: hypothetical protein [unclassified Flavobacterium]